MLCSLILVPKRDYLNGVLSIMKMMNPFFSDRSIELVKENALGKESSLDIISVKHSPKSKCNQSSCHELF